MTEGRAKPHTSPQGIFVTFPNICIQNYVYSTCCYLYCPYEENWRHGRVERIDKYIFIIIIIIIFIVVLDYWAWHMMVIIVKNNFD